MSFFESMKNRYTTKVYDKSKQLDPKKVEELKNILHMSPSSINSQPWQFVFVQDQELKNKLAEASYFNDEKVRNCDTLVVFRRVNNIEAFEKDIQERLPERTNTYYQQFLKPLPDDQIKSWFDKQVYLSIGVLLGACAEMGIDSTPMEGIEVDKYDQALGNDEFATLVAVAIGERHEDDFNQLDRVPKVRKEFDKVVKSM
ncbi:nitroreductase family protein [Aureibacter tunicatorum]|uniref:Nitroreductase/dihydropteridine reductase n=1 Tax=Aureibacter tunicatorum TaxID=866807 RepID=A0AAE3XLN1_9BACT|nr:nitroreductase family protein [Aureibacter tunicatorum]MDR6238717.1 nitroreductase/dihydropteridine reductase [Aureibacter tunicatorum]BDD05352.1 oxygen-insensitive NAD(P)H-dependent nitroreductase NfsB [Aureibacter tunicatorum]